MAAKKNRARSDLIALEGGPKDRYWYWSNDWDVHVASVRGQNFPTGHPANAALHYQPTTRTIEHPDPKLELGHGRVLAYSPPKAPAISRVLVTGSRTWTDTAIIRDTLARVWDPSVVLVSGACSHGADQLAEDCWTHWGGQIERWPADWNHDGKAAGFLRNRAMVDAGADLCLAFIRDRSRGATHCAVAAQEAGITTHIYRAG